MEVLGGFLLDIGSSSKADFGGARGKDGRCFHTAMPDEGRFKDADNVRESVLLWQMHVYQAIDKLSN